MTSKTKQEENHLAENGMTSAPVEKRMTTADMIKQVFPETTAYMAELIDKGYAIDFQIEMMDPLFDRSNILPEFQLVVFHTAVFSDEKITVKDLRYGSNRDWLEFTPEELNNFILSCLKDHQQRCDKRFYNENNSNARNGDQANGDDCAISQVQRANDGL